MRKWDKIVLSISAERLSRYYQHNSIVTSEDVIKIYTWNQELSMAIYPWLEWVEVALRNAIHFTLSIDRDSEWWFDDYSLINKEYQRQQVQSAKLTLKRQKKVLTPGKIVAELNFGFWTSLFHSDYEYQQILWPRLIPKIFPDIKRKLKNRKQISHRLRDIRLLRNRIFHYEPIWHWKDLMKKHNELKEILLGLNINLCEYAISRDKFYTVYDLGGRAMQKDLISYTKE